jgi:ATP-dependent DNA helicase RecG
MLALTAYGQVPMTVVGPHQGRGVETVVLRPAERERAYFAARDAVRAGRQVIIAFPTGKTADMVTASDARAIAAAMAQDILPGARVAIFSSALTREERYRSYDDFVHRKVDVLLATTAFETAPPVPNAAVLVVENANLVDVVRLHRLRNHLVHGFVRGSAFLVEGEEVDAAQHAVLELIAAEADGTRVADLDMARRGEAAVLGEAAADVPRLQWADPAQDRETLTKARQEAFRILRLDPALDRRAHRALAAVVRLRFGGEALDEAATESAALAESASASAPARRRRRRRR